MSQRNFYLFGVSSVLLSIALVVYSPDISRWLSQKFSSQESTIKKIKLADITDVDGSVSVRRRGSSQWERLKKGATAALYNYDRILLNRRGMATLNFASGYSLNLLENTHALVEAWDETTSDSPTYINFVQGDFQLGNTGTAGKLYVLLDGHLFTPDRRPTQAPQQIVIRQDAADLQKIQINPTTETIETESGITKTPPSAVSETSSPPSALAEIKEGVRETLSNEYIDEKIAAQREDFQRCQANILREEGNAQGQILVGLTIVPNGKVSGIKVLQTTLPSKNLESCVLSVFQRIQFDRFSGSPIVRSYPLNFE